MSILRWRGIAIRSLRHFEYRPNHIEQAQYRIAFLAAILDLLLYFAERENRIQFIEKHAPVSSMLTPVTTIDMNDAFAEIRSQNLNQAAIYFGAFPTTFNKPVHPFHRYAVITESFP